MVASGRGLLEATDEPSPEKAVPWPGRRSGKAHRVLPSGLVTYSSAKRCVRRRPEPASAAVPAAAAGPRAPPRPPFPPGPAAGGLTAAAGGRSSHPRRNTSRHGRAGGGKAAPARKVTKEPAPAAPGQEAALGGLSWRRGGGSALGTARNGTARRGTARHGASARRKWRPHEARGSRCSWLQDWVRRDVLKDYGLALTVSQVSVLRFPLSGGLIQKDEVDVNFQLGCCTGLISGSGALPLKDLYKDTYSRVWCSVFGR